MKYLVKLKSKVEGMKYIFVVVIVDISITI